MHKTKAEVALQVLRERIRAGELEPGRRLRLNELTHELGMSPTPIREALRLLQADGLVQFRPHQGIVVAELSTSETEEIVELRCVLEPLALGLAVPRMSDRELNELEGLHERLAAAVRSGRGTAISAGNEGWHWAIYEASGSAYLKEFIRRLWDVYPWRTAWALSGQPEQAIQDHEGIMEAIRAGDTELAGARLRVHIANTMDRLLARLEDEEASVADDEALGAER